MKSAKKKKKEEGDREEKRNNSIKGNNVTFERPRIPGSIFVTGKEGRTGRESHAANKPINRINGRRDLIKEWRLHPRQRCLHFARQLYHRCLSIGHEIR